MSAPDPSTTTPDSTDDAEARRLAAEQTIAALEKDRDERIAKIKKDFDLKIANVRRKSVPTSERRRVALDLVDRMRDSIRTLLDAPAMGDEDADAMLIQMFARQFKSDHESQPRYSDALATLTGQSTNQPEDSEPGEPPDEHSPQSQDTQEDAVTPSQENPETPPPDGS